MIDTNVFLVYLTCIIQQFEDLQKNIQKLVQILI